MTMLTLRGSAMLFQRRPDSSEYQTAALTTHNCEVDVIYRSGGIAFFEKCISDVKYDDMDVKSYPRISFAGVRSLLIKDPFSTFLL